MTPPTRQAGLSIPALRLPLLAILLGILVIASSATPSTAQNPLQQAAQRQAELTATFLNPDALRVFVCGSASPMGNSTMREQACLAVAAGGKIFLVDTGAGSAKNLSLASVPMARVEAVLLTHFHSDHIGALGDVNMSSWVGGRKQNLTVMGPQGVERVVNGFNEAFALDRGYRTAHHGEEVLPAATGAMVSKTLTPGVAYDEGGVKITAFPVNHHPIDPAFGYRFDYGGRSVVISGDTIKNDALISAAKDADLLFHDTLLPAIVNMVANGRKAAGDQRMAKLVADVLDYHAPVADVIASGKEADVKQTVLYHLVPSPPNDMIENQFLTGAPDNVTIAKDGMLFTLEAEGSAIETEMLFERK